MTPADTLALSADKLSQLLRDTIHERVLAAQAGEQMRSDVLGEDVRAICDVIAYEADVIAGVKFSLEGDWLVEWDTKSSGWGDPVICLTDLDRLACPGCDTCRPSQAVAA